MTVSRGNRRLVEQLRLSLDLAAIQAALDRDEITPRQAARLRKWTLTVIEVRENPLIPVADPLGGWIGEVITENRGASWIGRRGQGRWPTRKCMYAGHRSFVDLVTQGCNGACLLDVAGHSVDLPAPGGPETHNPIFTQAITDHDAGVGKAAIGAL